MLAYIICDVVFEDQADDRSPKPVSDTVLDDSDSSL